jgi:hypothetical protein
LHQEQYESDSDETRLRLGVEASKIKEALRRSTYRDRFIFAEEHSVRLDTLRGVILRERPSIVHFSGHGSHAGELVFESQSGAAVAGDADAIGILFRLAGRDAKLVVLNACYSKRQALKLSETVDAVIGMANAIADMTAIAFSSALYENLGEGCDLKAAFELAKNDLDLRKLPGSDLPDLIERVGVAASKVQLVTPS